MVKQKTMPKRKGHILEQIADMDNLLAADKAAQAGKKKNRYIRRHNLRQKEDLEVLQGWILNPETLPEAKYKPMTLLNDNGKQRTIGRLDFFPWHVLHHSIMRVVAPIMLKSLIDDTFACVPGKGLHYGVKRMSMMLRRYPEQRWFWKVDYKKYYESIPHETIEAAFRHKFKDEKFMLLVKKSILNYDSGETIKSLLDAEYRKRARYSHRRISKSDIGKLRDRTHGPQNEGGSHKVQVLSQVLR